MSEGLLRRPQQHAELRIDCPQKFPRQDSGDNVMRLQALKNEKQIIRLKSYCRGRDKIPIFKGRHYYVQ